MMFFFWIDHVFLNVYVYVYENHNLWLIWFTDVQNIFFKNIFLEHF